MGLQSWTQLSNFLSFIFFLSSYASMRAYFNSVFSLPLLLSLLDVSYVKYHSVLQKILHMPLTLKCFPVYSPLSHPTARGMFLKCMIMILLYFKFLQHSTCIQDKVQMPLHKTKRFLPQSYRAISFFLNRLHNIFHLFMSLMTFYTHQG